MGNVGSSSCCLQGDNNEGRCCCFGIRSNRKSGKMVPADLHSSSAQATRSVKDQKQAQAQSRPTTLQMQNTSVSPSSESCDQQSRQKFLEFSLHGVQKTSPFEQSDQNLNFQEKIVDQRFLAENVLIFYNKYKDKDCDDILPEGIARFCLDLDVDPAEFIVLALAWKFKAAAMCKFTREEFTEGCIALQAHSISSLKDSFQSLEGEALENFKDLYKFAFQFGLDVEQGQRSLPSDVAVGMWQVVFSKNPPVLLGNWLKFLEESKIRGISRDTWNMFLYFTENVGEDLVNYDDNEAWPSLFDDFVEHFRNKEVEVAQLEKEREIEVDAHLIQKEQSSQRDYNHPQVSDVSTKPGEMDGIQPRETEEVTLHRPETVLANEVGAAFVRNEVNTSRNSLSECPFATEKPSSEFDSDLIQCETLHSSHIT